MSETWFSLNSGCGRPEENMAWDEALLEYSATLGSPVLRFYGWTVPAATFGYSQRYREVAQWTALRPLIRRPTGGGLVLHDADWTYSLVFPPQHPWYRVKAVESYRRVHEWLQTASARLGVETALSPMSRKDAPGQCFSGAERFDLVWKGRKIAGAAQRRNKLGLLVQGSVQSSLTGISRDAWEQAVHEAALGDVLWEEFMPRPALEDRVGDLACEKYAQDAHNRAR